MNKVFYALLAVLALTSCANSYNIQGSSNISTLDGHKLYLKVVADEELKDIDSCDVVHGVFSFAGNIDSTQMANIYMDKTSLIPVVLESGEIVIKLNDTQQTVGGTPLNDKLFTFMKGFDQLQNEAMELGHKQAQAIMNGNDMEIVNRQLAQQDAQITKKMDEMLTTFVTENFDNVLGPGVFMMMTASFPYPVLTPWIEDIMSKATDRFKNDPYVKRYVEAANHNQNMMNGMADTQSAPAPAPGTVAGSTPALPTPSQMAGDSIKR